MDISNLSRSQLADLIRQAEKRRMQLSKRKPAAVVRKRVEQLVRASGYTLMEVLGASGSGAPSRKRMASRGTRQKTSTVAPKYRNPDNAEQTWTGRGKMPKWLSPMVAAGRSLDEFRIA